MTHMELVFYRLYPNAIRITAKDTFIPHNYEYLVKNDDDAKDLLKHLQDAKFREIYMESLYKEVD